MSLYGKGHYSMSLSQCVYFISKNVTTSSADYIYQYIFFFKWLIKILSFKTFSKQTFSCLSYTCIFLILSYEYFTCKNLIKIFMFSCCWYIWGEWTKRLSINKIPVLRLCQLDLNWIRHKWFKCILKISSPLVSQCKRKGYPVNSVLMQSGLRLQVHISCTINVYNPFVQQVLP